MVNDPISDFIIALKNAALVGKDSVRVSYSSVKHNIASTLEKEGFLTKVTKRDRTIGHPQLEVVLALDESGSPKIHDVKRISKPSRRIYHGVKHINPVRHGYGKAIISTPNGIMTGDAARKAGVGGEALFEIW